MSRSVFWATGTLALLVALSVVRSAFDDGPTPQELRCQQLQVAANAVTQREDTVDDELEYLRRARAAERACSGVG
jgi:hypothetical protein